VCCGAPCGDTDSAVKDPVSLPLQCGGSLTHSCGICDREEEKASSVPVLVYKKVSVYVKFPSAEKSNPNPYKAHDLESGTLPPLSR